MMNSNYNHHQQQHHHQGWSGDVARRMADSIHCEVKSMVENSRLVRKGQSLALVKREDIHVKTLLGRGAFSEVHLVSVANMKPHNSSRGCDDRQQQLDDPAVEDNGTTTLAMKHLKPKLMSQPENFRLAAAELAVEAHMLASFDHPNILKIRGWAANGVASFIQGRYDSFFLLLDKLDLTLDQQIAQWQKQQSYWQATAPNPSYNNIVVDLWRRWSQTTVDKAEAAREQAAIREQRHQRESLLADKLRICSEIASALSYLHDCGVIFRDLKPNNLGLINGRVQLFDFGLSREIPNGDDLEQPYEMSGKVGTLRYMAVEVASHHAYNVSADVYSWAMVCYEVLTLKKPFAGWTRDMHADLVCRRGMRPDLHVETSGGGDSSSSNTSHNNTSKQQEQQHQQHQLPDKMKSLLEVSWSQDATRRPTMKAVCQKLATQRQAQAVVVQSLEGQQQNQHQGEVIVSDQNDTSMCIELPSDFNKEHDIRKVPARNPSELTASTAMSTESWDQEFQGSGVHIWTDDNSEQ